MNYPLLVALIIIVIMILVWRRPAESLTNINTGRQVTLYYVTWCPACAQMRPVWDRVKGATQGSGITFLEIDADETKNTGIMAYPTIHMLTQSGRVVAYGGPAEFSALLNWVVAPVP